MDNNLIVKTAREYIDTPFHHQGRQKGVGIDCGGLIVCTLAECQIYITDLRGYGRYPHADTMRKAMRKEFDEITKEEMTDGDILLFALGREPSHLAFKTNIGMIHAYTSVKKVVEHSLDYRWEDRIVAVFRVKTNG